MRMTAGIAIALLAIGGLFYFFNQNQAPQNTSQEVNTEVTKNTETLAGVPTDCSGVQIPQLTEGPYYTPNTPERQDIREPVAVGEPLILEGYVFDTNCEPISNAWIDFWQADGQGNYDNVGYQLRGHQYTDESGYYKLETVLPTRYTGRTEHIHFKIRTTDTSPTITSQLFLPNSEANESDSIFNENLIVTMGEETDDTNHAYYNFVVEK